MTKSHQPHRHDGGHIFTDRPPSPPSPPPQHHHNRPTTSARRPRAPRPFISNSAFTSTSTRCSSFTPSCKPPPRPTLPPLPLTMLLLFVVFVAVAHVATVSRHARALAQSPFFLPSSPLSVSFPLHHLGRFTSTSFTSWGGEESVPFTHAAASDSDRSAVVSKTNAVLASVHVVLACARSAPCCVTLPSIRTALAAVVSQLTYSSQAHSPPSPPAAITVLHDCPASSSASLSSSFSLPSGDAPRIRLTHCRSGDFETCALRMLVRLSSSSSSSPSSSSSANSTTATITTITPLPQPRHVLLLSYNHVLHRGALEQLVLSLSPSFPSSTAAVTALGYSRASTRAFATTGDLTALAIVRPVSVAHPSGSRSGVAVDDVNDRPRLSPLLVTQSAFADCCSSSSPRQNDGDADEDVSSDKDLDMEAWLRLSYIFMGCSPDRKRLHVVRAPLYTDLAECDDHHHHSNRNRRGRRSGEIEDDNDDDQQCQSLCMKGPSYLRQMFARHTASPLSADGVDYKRRRRGGGHQERNASLSSSLYPPIVPVSLRSRAALHKLCAQADERAVHAASRSIHKSSSSDLSDAFPPYYLTSSFPTSDFVTTSSTPPPRSPLHSDENATASDTSSLPSPPVPVVFIVGSLSPSFFSAAVLRLLSQLTSPVSSSSSAATATESQAQQQARTQRQFDVTVVTTDGRWRYDTGLGEPVYAPLSPTVAQLELLQQHHHHQTDAASHISGVFDLALHQQHFPSTSTSSSSLLSPGFAVLRHVLVTRRPQIVVLAHSRWGYDHLPLMHSVMSTLSPVSSSSASKPTGTVFVDILHNAHAYAAHAARASLANHTHATLTTSTSATAAVARRLGVDFVEMFPSRVRTCDCGGTFDMRSTGLDFDNDGDGDGDEESNEQHVDSAVAADQLSVEQRYRNARQRARASLAYAELASVTAGLPIALSVGRFDAMSGHVAVLRTVVHLLPDVHFVFVHGGDNDNGNGAVNDVDDNSDASYTFSSSSATALRAALLTSPAPQQLQQRVGNASFPSPSITVIPWHTLAANRLRDLYVASDVVLVSADDDDSNGGDMGCDAMMTGAIAIAMSSSSSSSPADTSSSTFVTHNDTGYVVRTVCSRRDSSSLSSNASSSTLSGTQPCEVAVRSTAVRLAYAVRHVTSYRSGNGDVDEEEDGSASSSTSSASSHDVARVRANAFRTAHAKCAPNVFPECVENMLKLAVQRHSWQADGRSTNNSSESSNSIVNTTITSATDATLLHPILHAEQQLHDASVAALRALRRPLHDALTVVVKTHVCASANVAQLRALVRSIRHRHRRVRVLLGNDGPLSVARYSFVVNDAHTDEIMLHANSGISYGRNALVAHVTTKYVALLDDDHMLSNETNLARAVASLAAHNFDIVGLRVRNNPGIDELDRAGIVIPRYVANVTSVVGRTVRLCVWNENNGPDADQFSQPGVAPLRVDVLHNAFIARTHTLRDVVPWRDELEVNEHMTFFLDARRAGVVIGYLPSQEVVHVARVKTRCYSRVRNRERAFAKLLDYDDDFAWDKECGDGFPGVVQSHIDWQRLQK